MSPRWDPAWIQCVTCGRDKKGHDAAERLVLPASRHRFVTPSAEAARARRDTNQPALPLNPNARPKRNLP